MLKGSSGSSYGSIPQDPTPSQFGQPDLANFRPNRQGEVSRRPGTGPGSRQHRLSSIVHRFAFHIFSATERRCMLPNVLSNMLFGIQEKCTANMQCTQGCLGEVYVLAESFSLQSRITQKVSCPCAVADGHMADARGEGGRKGKRERGGWRNH